MTKSLLQDAAIVAGKKADGMKTDVQMAGNKQWAVRPAPFKRSDGSISHDKTRGAVSRPGAKLTARNANRAITKRGRQLLKRRLGQEIEEL